MALLRTSKEVFEKTQTVLRALQDLPHQKQLAVLAAAQMMVNFENGLKQLQEQEVEDE
jgi:phytoene/squalene synthetase